MEINLETADAARAFFPRGLTQSPGSFRFSCESLLLASFAPLKPGLHLLDLGCGCGVTALAALCLMPSIQVTGVEIQEEPAQAAKRNAARLGFAANSRIIHADLADSGFFAHLDPHSFDLVLANPPYRQPEKGRIPKSLSRRIALFEEKDSLDIFCRTAYKSLKNSGMFVILYPVARLAELALVLDRSGLAPLRRLFLCAKAGQVAKLALTAAGPKSATRSGTDTQTCEETLILHTDDGAFSSEALAFCPFLVRKNPPI
ncbi:MAG: methyltransferase [Desulfovibrio sp.]|jgi:tRNA1Val (adenine37-N6)-methyltransferase|nr:methyltransferase [Desulfovibrio sp.]